MRRAVRGRRSSRDDAGIALVVVLATMFLVTAVLLTGLGYVASTASPARRDQDAKTALAAAQAGIDEYVSRLSADSNYWQRGDTDAANPAFGAGTPVAGAGSASGSGSFTYHVASTTTSTLSTGAIMLRSTGRASAPNGRPVTRALLATIRVSGFLNYIYLDDIEVIDPAISGTSAGCATYYYAGRSSMNGCAEIRWAGADTVQGPLHSNDALQIDGPVNFTSPTTESSWPALSGTSSSTTWWGSQPPPLAGYPPVYAPAIALPASNVALLSSVSPDPSTGSTAGPGCYYEGPTEIVLAGSSMQIRSPGTTDPATPLRCYNRAIAGSWQTISPVPPVIYVDTGSTPCPSTSISYPLAGETYPNGTSTAVSWGTGINYACSRGSVYVQGQTATSVTVAAADDVVVTGDLTVPSLDGPTTIGLIAGNCAWVYHPLRNSANLPGFTPADTVQASILALGHSFLVENWSTGGTLGTLNVTGSISQKFRGPVATSNNGTIVTGYSKNYVYDDRLQVMQPPYFLQPSSAPWRLTAVATS